MASVAPIPAVHRLSRAHAVVRQVARAWRDLTGGGRDRDPDRRTLIACSGGADSSALVIALASAVPGPRPVPRSSPGSGGDDRADHPNLPFVIAHVVHDLRPRPEALADRDAAKSLAESLGLPFVEADVRTQAQRGNPESIARRLRYKALARLAPENNCRYVATAHHADDQLETVLMALLRGSGPRGLAGIARSRSLRPAATPDLRRSAEGPGSEPTPPRDAGPEALRRRSGVDGPDDKTPTLIRPMLCITRADAERLCLDAAWTWRDDATNCDRSRLRNALRHDVLPALRRIRPRAARHAVEAAQLLADAADLIRDVARASLSLPVPRPSPIFGGDGRADGDNRAITWPRHLLRAQPPVILGELLRLAANQLQKGQRRDRLGLKRLAPAIRYIRGTSTEPRRFTWSGLTLEANARTVTLAMN